MSDLLDALGLSADAWQKRADLASKHLAADADNFMPGPKAPPMLAPQPAHNDPNIPLASSTTDLVDPGYDKFFAALPPAKSPDQKMAEIRRRLEDMTMGASISDPTIGGNPAYDKGLEKAAFAQFSDGAAKDQDAAGKAMADYQADLAQWKDTAQKYLAMGLTPPAMPQPPGGAPAPSAQDTLALNSALKGGPSDKAGQSADEDSGDDVRTSSKVKVSSSSPRGGGRAAASEAAPSTPKAKQDYLQNLLSKIYGPGMGADALMQAQALKNQNEAAANLSKAGNIIGAGFTKGAIKPNTEVQDDLLKQAGDQEKDILTRRAAAQDQIGTALKLSDFQDHEQMRDPDSSLSQAYRKMASQYGVAISPDMTAEGVKQMLPFIDMRLKMEALAEARADRRESKDKELYDRNERQFGDRISQLYSPRGAAGRAAIVDQAADRLLNYAAQFKDRNDLSPQEVELVVKDLGTIMSGGAATEGSSKRLMPSTLMSNLSKLAQTISNRPTGADLGAFVSRMEKAAKELKHQAQDYERFHSNKLLESYKNSLRPSFYEAKRKEINGIDDGSGQQAGGVGKVVKINGVDHLVPPGTDLQAVKKAVQDAGGTYQE